MLSPPPCRQQCHHPAGSPKAGKHLQLVQFAVNIVWHSWDESVWTISERIVMKQVGSISRKTGSRGWNPLMLSRSAGERTTSKQWKSGRIVSHQKKIRIVSHHRIVSHQKKISPKSHSILLYIPLWLKHTYIPIVCMYFSSAKELILLQFQCGHKFPLDIVVAKSRPSGCLSQPAETNLNLICTDSRYGEMFLTFP